MKGIEELQSVAIDYILEGKKMTEVARCAGIHRSQLYRWLDKPEFKAELEKRRAQLRKSANDKITGQVDMLSDEMLKLATSSTDQRVRYNAIKYLLDRSLGVPTAAKEEVNNDDKDKNKDTNTLKKELDEIKNLKVVK